MNEEERDAYLADMRNRDQEQKNNMNEEERDAYLSDMRNKSVTKKQHE